MTNCLIGLILEAREIVLGNPMEYLTRRGSFDEDLITEDDKKRIDVPFFSLNSILVATDNFSNATKLGRGGFGPVYKVFSYFFCLFCSLVVLLFKFIYFRYTTILRKIIHTG